MKKSLIVILSMLFVLGLTVSAFAIHAEIPSETQSVVAKGTTQITLGGEIRLRGEFKKNVLDFDDDIAGGKGGSYGTATTTDNYAAYDQRVRLHLQADVTPNTMGFIQLESGDSNTSDTYTWGSPDEGATGNVGGTLGNAKRGDLRILQAWIQHKGSGLLGTPAGIKVGHMPIKLGNGLFLDHSKYGDDAILLFADPTKEMHVALAHVKFNEGATTSTGMPVATAGNDDDNAYSLLFNYKVNGINFGGDVLYGDLQDFSTPTGTQTEPLHFWNFGLRGDTTVAGLKLYADLEVQTGKAKRAYDDPNNTAVTDIDRKYKGYAWMVGGNYTVSDVTLGLETAYGSGDKIDGSKTVADSGAKNESFVTSLGADPHYTYVYEYRAPSAAGTPGTGSNTVHTTGTGLANTWYIKASASAKPMKDLTAALSLYYLRAAKGVAIMGATNSNGSPKVSKKIGVEVDGKVTYQIDKNLIYFVEGGYLFAGSAYDIGSHMDTALSDGENKKADDAYAVRHGVTLTF